MYRVYRGTPYTSHEEPDGFFHVTLVKDPAFPLFYRKAAGVGELASLCLLLSSSCFGIPTQVVGVVARDGTQRSSYLLVAGT